ncbi:MAG TPA: class I SAM-dependent methyltransferase [Actinomycetota bacterium]|nr:class I SAM-dependent methyltransferase [Actinomycetota bacterium]
MGIIDRFSAGPVDLVRRLLHKTVIGPIKYRSSSGGYDAERYWRDRLQRYGISLRASGHEGWSEEDNRSGYEIAAQTLIEAERDAGVDLSTARVVEIGCGPGFYARLHRDLGVTSYTGVDVTDVLFQQLREGLPEYRFLQADVTRDRLEVEGDIVLMIDVAHHIVTDEAMNSAMENVKRVLAPGGVFLVGPLMSRERSHLFYVRFWSEEEIRSRFPGFEQLRPVHFRGGTLLGFRSRTSAGRIPGVI